MRFLIDRSWGTDAASPVLGAWRMARRLPASQHERLLQSLITFFTRPPLHVYLRRGVVRLAPEMVRWYDACLRTCKNLTSLSEGCAQVASAPRKPGRIV